MKAPTLTDTLHTLSALARQISREHGKLIGNHPGTMIRMLGFTNWQAHRESRARAKKDPKSPVVPLVNRDSFSQEDYDTWFESRWCKELRIMVDRLAEGMARNKPGSENTMRDFAECLGKVHAMLYDMGF